jgi:prephenate dehydrogenase
LERFSSPTFSNLLAVARKVYSENPHLYFEIQGLNPYSEQAFRFLDEAFSEFISAIKDCKEGDFVNIMANGEQFLQGQS